MGGGSWKSTEKWLIKGAFLNNAENMNEEGSMVLAQWEGKVEESESQDELVGNP